MSVEKQLRDLIRSEVAGQLRDLRDLEQRLAPLLGMLGGAKRGPGRPPKSAAPPPARRGRPRKTTTAACAIIDCGKPALSKGYCSSHYQKFRKLQKADRLPSGWVADAAPNSVENVVLPRGRAAAKAKRADKK
jgi:hypothetical protein